MNEQRDMDYDSLAGAAASVMSVITGQTIVAAHRIQMGVMTFKYMVATAADERFIVRFYPPERSSVVHYEPDIVRRCRTHGIRVPEVVADSRSGPAAPLAYMAYRMITGTVLRDQLAAIGRTELEATAGQLVTQLRLLAELRMEGYGDVLDGGHARFPTWIDFVRNAFDEGLAFADKERLLGTEILDSIAAVRSRIDDFTAPEPSVLAWGDFSPDNIIVNDRGLAGLVDLEGVVAADVHLNLGYLRARYRRTSFYDAVAGQWPAPMPSQPLPALYVIVRALRLLRHGCELLPTGNARDPIEVFLPDFHPALTEVLKLMGRKAILGEATWRSK